MTWALLWSPRALRDLRRLDRQTAERVIAALERYAQTEVGAARPLHGSDRPDWRLRVGDWRVRFARDTDAGVIEALHVLHRREAYR